MIKAKIDGFLVGDKIKIKDNNLMFNYIKEIFYLLIPFNSNHSFAYKLAFFVDKFINIKIYAIG